MLYAMGDEPNGLFGVLAGGVHISHTTSGASSGFCLWFGPDHGLAKPPSWTVVHVFWTPTRQDAATCCI